MDSTIATFWIEFSGTLQLVIKGLLIGILVSSPMGPVGILCIQRTLKKGRIYGLVTGAGAALSDLVYAVITGFGMIYVMQFIENPEFVFWLKIGGSVLLFVFGWKTFKTKIFKPQHQSSGKKDALFNNFFSSFLLTLGNPLIIFLFVALYAQFTFTVPANPLGVLLGYLSILGGAMLWWLGLTYTIKQVQQNFGEKGMLIINRAIGALVIAISLVYALATLFRINVQFY